MTGRRRAFTLVEVLVALGVFTVLGFGATAFLIMGLRNWRGAEARRDMAERAELVFAFLRADFECMYAAGDKAPGRAIFLSDEDAGGRQRLILTRTVPPPGADPRIAGAGLTVLARDVIDGAGDLASLRRGLLKPPGDLMCAAYVFIEDEKLYRSVVTPEKSYGEVAGDWPTHGAQLLAEGVMHLEFNFWSDRTTAWRSEAEGFGPSYFWDSTQGLAKEKAAAEEGRRRRIFTAAGSLQDAIDDDFPRLIETRIVLGTSAEAAYLAGNIEAGATAIAVENGESLPREEGEHFVKLGREWISYGRLRGDVLTGVVRGRRGTQAASHEAGTAVRTGTMFRMVARPPCGREAWREVAR